MRPSVYANIDIDRLCVPQAAMGPGYSATTMRILQAGELIEDDTTPSALSLAGSTCLHVVARVAK